jgi:RHS repeat-associated protein
VQYAYDGFGRLAARTDNEGTTQYLYGNPDNPLLLTEVREPDATLTQYFYDEAGLLFAMDRDGTRYYIATDQVGTPRLVSDASGSVVKRMTFDSWGVQIEDSNPAFSMPFGFAGGLATTETGMVRFGFRDYDPLVGRWMARDPILYQGGQANLYAYANNDPVNYHDPSGLLCIGASVFDVVGIGAKVCIDSNGASACLEAGVGFGGGFEVDLAGGAASATDKSYASASVGGSCGPFSAGVGIKLNSCGEVKKNCGVAVGAGGGPGDGFAGKLFKGFGFSCSGSAKAATDPTVGEKINSSSKKFNVNKVKCSVGAKAVVGACVTSSF